jgi:hypothetical protein
MGGTANATLDGLKRFGQGTASQFAERPKHHSLSLPFILASLQHASINALSLTAAKLVYAVATQSPDPEVTSGLEMTSGLITIDVANGTRSTYSPRTSDVHRRDAPYRFKDL